MKYTRPGSFPALIVKCCCGSASWGDLNSVLLLFSSPREVKVEAVRMQESRVVIAEVAMARRPLLSTDRPLISRKVYYP